jgi:hypothetical protein
MPHPSLLSWGAQKSGFREDVSALDVHFPELHKEVRLSSLTAVVRPPA